MQDLIKHIEIGKLPVVVYCEKKYDGICCMLKLTKNNTVFLDYDDTYDDSDSEGSFRAIFKYDSFDEMINAIERYTNRKLSELVLEPCCYELFECVKPQWQEFKWELYNGNIQMLDGYESFRIGSFYWNAIYQKVIRPDISTEELAERLKRGEILI